MQSSVLETLFEIYAQILALSALFVALGRSLLSRLLPPAAGRAWPLSLTYGAGYFVGLYVFQALFVASSRALESARAGFWASVGVSWLVAISAARVARPKHRTGEQIGLIAKCLALVASFSVTTATYWLAPTVEQMIAEHPAYAHVGSIHSGRYANYAIAIAGLDRVPYIAQDMGQSMMASWPLLLGTRSPLAALACWLPVSLSALACLIFGVLREHALPRVTSLAGTFFVLLCNIALSLSPTFQLDNGSPVLALGYSDAVAAVGTFLLASLWLREMLTRDPPLPKYGFVLVFILALVWAWTAPQNIVIGGAVAVGAFFVFARSTADFRALLGRLAVAGAGFVAGAVLGMIQLGPLLPAARRESVGVEVVHVGLDVQLRPYVSYLMGHWSWFKGYPSVPEEPGIGWQGPTLIYERLVRDAAPHGDAAIFMRCLHVFETELWTSLRVYGFLLLGIMLLGWRLRAMPMAAARRVELRAWFWMALFSFLVGYAIAFFLELDRTKWWLTRFLLPATGSCLVALSLATAASPNAPRRRPKLAFVALIVLGTFGPLLELTHLFRWSWFQESQNHPLGRRLEVLVESEGPYVK